VAGVSRRSSRGTRRYNRADGAATRDRILECAGELFARTGFAETTSKAVAAAAGVDLASINYHFGSRTGLYQAVLAEAHRRLITLDLLENLERADVPARVKLARVIDAFVEGALTRRGWHPRVLGRELFAPSSNLEILVRREALPKIEVIAHVISELTGIPAGDPALPRCVLTVAAPCIMLFVAPTGVPGPLQAVRRMPRAELVAHLHRFALAGLKATAREYAGRMPTQDGRSPRQPNRRKRP
jgi:AcrR family transcriptional regulator